MSRGRGGGAAQSASVERERTVHACKVRPVAGRHQDCDAVVVRERLDQPTKRIRRARRRDPGQRLIEQKKRWLHDKRACDRHAGRICPVDVIDRAVGAVERPDTMKRVGRTALCMRAGAAPAERWRGDMCKGGGRDRVGELEEGEADSAGDAEHRPLCQIDSCERDCPRGRGKHAGHGLQECRAARPAQAPYRDPLGRLDAERSVAENDLVACSAPLVRSAQRHVDQGEERHVAIVAR